VVIRGAISNVLNDSLNEIHHLHSLQSIHTAFYIETNHILMEMHICISPSEILHRIKGPFCLIKVIYL
jgi:hypothetical protein